MNDKDKKIMEDIMNSDLCLKDRFNLLLVFRRKRPACIINYKFNKIGKTKDYIIGKKKELNKRYNRRFPFFKFTQDTISTIVSLNKLPNRKKSEDLYQHVGRILGYDVPLNWQESWKYNKIVEYNLYKDGKEVSQIHTEIVKYYNQVNPQKLKDYNEVAKEIGYRVKLVKKKLERK